MTFIEFIKAFSFKDLEIIFQVNNLNLNSTNTPSSYLSYLSLSTIIFNFLLIVFFILFTINFIIHIFFKNNSRIFKFFKFVNIMVYCILDFLLLLKLYISFKIESFMNGFILQERRDLFMSSKDTHYLEHFTVFTSSLSDIIIILSLTIGIICLENFGSRNLLYTINNNSIFYLFNIFVVIMVSTNNLLIMFICFECIFLPTVFFAYRFGYSRKIDAATIALFTWTFFGSFMVLTGLSYMFYQCSSLNLLSISEKMFSDIEKRLLTFCFIFGFAIKIPLAPLHHWLLRVHVESPTAYSVFLSGFLVKSALYCLVTLISQLYINSESLVSLCWFLYSMFISTLAIGRQVDIKRLIAWCTVQEMSFILLFWGIKHTYIDKLYLLFMLIHGLMAAYMFFLVDVIQRRFFTRSLSALSGINAVAPQLTKYVWFLIFIFSGFPLSVKFMLEWNFFSMLAHFNFFVALFAALIVSVAGIILFSKIMFQVLYGTPRITHNSRPVDLEKRDIVILNSLIYQVIALLIIAFYI